MEANKYEMKRKEENREKNWITFIKIVKWEIRYTKREDKKFSFRTKCKEISQKIRDCNNCTIDVNEKTIGRYLNFQITKPQKNNTIYFIIAAMRVFDFDLIGLYMLDMYYCAYYANKGSDAGTTEKGSMYSEENLDIYIKHIRTPALEQAKIARNVYGTVNNLLKASKSILISREMAEKELKHSLFKEYITDDNKEEIFLIYKIYNSFSKPVKVFCGELFEYWLKHKLYDVSESYKEVEDSGNECLKEIWGIESKSISFENFTFEDIEGDFKNLLLLKKEYINNDDISNKNKMKFKEFSEKSEKICARELYIAYNIYLLRNRKEKEGIDKMVNLMLRFYCLTKQKPNISYQSR